MSITRLADLEPAWRRYLRANDASNDTIKNYLRTLHKVSAYLEEHGLPGDPREIQPGHLQDFLLDYADRTSTNSALFHYRNLLALYAWACSDEERMMKRSESPMLDVKRPKARPVERPTFTTEQVAAMIKACRPAAGKRPTFEDRRDEAIIRVFYNTGVRIGGMVSIRYAPDANGSLEHPGNDLALDARPPLVRVKLKGNKLHRVPLLPDTVTALDRYLRARAQHPQARESALWLGRSGGLRAPGVSDMLKRRARKAGLDIRIHAHRFRRTTTAHLLDSGAGRTAVAKWMGWANVDMVGLYASESEERRAWEQVAGTRFGDQV